MVILGLDLGSVTCGVAKSDPTGLIASTLTTIRFAPDDYDSCLDQLLELVAEVKPDKIVIGLPKHMNGDIGEKGQLCLAFKDQLQLESGIEVIAWDERLTTVMSQRMLIGADMSRKKRKKVVDKVAATYILQGYLDSLRNQ